MVSDFEALFSKLESSGFWSRIHWIEAKISGFETGIQWILEAKSKILAGIQWIRVQNLEIFAGIQWIRERNDEILEWNPVDSGQRRASNTRLTGSPTRIVPVCTTVP